MTILIARSHSPSSGKHNSRACQLSKSRHLILIHKTRSCDSQILIHNNPDPDWWHLILIHKSCDIWSTNPDPVLHKILIPLHHHLGYFWLHRLLLLWLKSELLHQLRHINWAKFELQFLSSNYIHTHFQLQSSYSEVQFQSSYIKVLSLCLWKYKQASSFLSLWSLLFEMFSVILFLDVWGPMNNLHMTPWLHVLCYNFFHQMLTMSFRFNFISYF